MTKTAKIISSIIIVVAAVLIGYSIGSKSKLKPISISPKNDLVKLGFIAPLTGDQASIGQNMRVAVELARDEINGSGGVGGKKLDIIFEDSQCDAKTAVNAANKLVNSDKVMAIIGGYCSSETLAIAPLTNQAKIPLMSAASTNPKITQAGDYVFRLIPSDTFQGKFAADYLVKTLDKKRIAILYCLSDWCVGVREVAKQRVLEDGGQIVADEGYEQTSRDLRSQISKIKNANPDVIYFLGYTEATIVGLKQIRELGLSIPIFGGDTWDDPKIPQEAGTAANGAKYHVTANRELPQWFIDEMKKRNADKDLNTYSPRAYDVAKVLSMAIAKVGTGGEQIKNELYNLKDYQGIADVYTMDVNGDMTTANYIIKEFLDEKAVEVK